MWWGIPEFNIIANNITVPGLSPIFPDVHCTDAHDVCQLTTGEGEINAATTIMALTLNPNFDLTKTYFFIAGIGGVNPQRASLGSANFARYAVQVALQQEIDPRELPANYSTGYIPQGSYAPFDEMGNVYGSEVFELNADLRTTAVQLAKTGKLKDTREAQDYRANYATPDNVFEAAVQPPSVIGCDVATSDVYYSGDRLSSAFDNISKVWTNGTAEYCNSAQEDNATLEALLRASVSKLTDFSRIIVMRTASDYDRPPPTETAAFHLLYSDQGGGSELAFQNIYHAGLPVILGILSNWNSTFYAGIKPSNYIGDILGSLGGEPDFGPGKEEALERAV